ncbi:hypothetical protein MAMC_01458 [Methylacidimicrobium cyclopophantes]|uniref:Uncharacterized protein n=1 Tax=Methylacidimicrobium cyclopophantes TaxID=1041766 RepID=A0A5E6MFN1_9BACT|nr:hypothetical protein [Methylacidimicrobium cyclopophantes]VVM07158.1 hypothetical protein MAMC_01458 [Methylacidimicrobium cyclopophantes]
MLGDLLAVTTSCILLFLVEATGQFLLAFAAAVLLAGGCWWLASNYTKLWNLLFHANPIHHFFCAVAALATLASALLFFALSHAKTAGTQFVDLWAASLQANQSWKSSTFEEARKTVWQLGQEPHNPALWQDQSGGPIVPLTNPNTKFVVAKIYANGAARNFQRMHPFLSWILSVHVRTAEEAVSRDVQQYLNVQPNAVYPDTRAIGIVADYVKKELDEQTPKLVPRLRLILLLLFLAVQSVPFTLIGWAAYQDIQIRA